MLDAVASGTFNPLTKRVTISPGAALAAGTGSEYPEAMIWFWGCENRREVKVQQTKPVRTRLRFFERGTLDYVQNAERRIFNYEPTDAGIRNQVACTSRL